MLVGYFQAQKFDPKSWLSGWTRGCGKNHRCGGIFLGESNGQNKLLWKAFWLLFWKPGHVFLACTTSVLTHFLPGTCSSYQGKGSPGSVFLSWNSWPGKPFWILAVIILQFTWPHTPALHSYFFTWNKGALGSVWQHRKCRPWREHCDLIKASQGLAPLEQHVDNSQLEGLQEWPSWVSSFVIIKSPYIPWNQGPSSAFHDDHRVAGRYGHGSSWASSWIICYV